MFIFLALCTFNQAVLVKEFYGFILKTCFQPYSFTNGSVGKQKLNDLKREHLNWGAFCLFTDFSTVLNYLEHNILTHERMFIIDVVESQIM